VWAVTKVIFKYTGFPGEKIPQKVLGATFFTRTVSLCPFLNDTLSSEHAMCEPCDHDGACSTDYRQTSALEV